MTESGHVEVIRPVGGFSPESVRAAGRSGNCRLEKAGAFATQDSRFIQKLKYRMKMKRIKNIMTVALLGASVAFTSCDDWLSLDPENAVPADLYWQSKEDVSAAMTGIYCSVLGTSKQMLMHGEMRADFATQGRVLNSGYKNIREGNIISSNEWVTWTSYYHVINNCNLLLERSDMALEHDPSFTPEECTNYKSQALVIRALMYFYLIRTYKDVPYVTWAYYDDQTDRNCAVTSQMDILNDLIAQLEKIQQTSGALAYSYSQTSAAQNKGQVTMYMLKALLADMYRWKGALEMDQTASEAAYQRCVDLCDEIIGCGQFALIPVPKTDAKAAVGTYLEDASTHADSCFYVILGDAADNMFDQIYVKGNSSESIFELQVDDYTATPFYSLFCGNSTLMPNDAHLTDDIFLPTNNECARTGNYEDIRYKINSVGQGESKLCWKYAGRDLNGTSYVNNAEFDKNVLVYRLAEIYLMKAEALNQIAWIHDDDPAMLVEAYKAVFKVRDRAAAVEATDVLCANSMPMQVQYWDELRNDSSIVLNSFTELSCRDMEQFILDEEGRELMFEGRRWFDVLRHAARNNYGSGSCKGGNLNYLLSIVINSTTIDKVTYLRNAYQNYESHYLPYPKQDVSLNKLLTQKPFYGTE